MLSAEQYYEEEFNIRPIITVRLSAEERLKNLWQLLDMALLLNQVPWAEELYERIQTIQLKEHTSK